MTLHAMMRKRYSWPEPGGTTVKYTAEKQHQQMCNQTDYPLWSPGTRHSLLPLTLWSSGQELPELPENNLSTVMEDSNDFDPQLNSSSWTPSRKLLLRPCIRRRRSEPLNFSPDHSSIPPRQIRLNHRPAILGSYTEQTLEDQAGRNQSREWRMRDVEHTYNADQVSGTLRLRAEVIRTPRLVGRRLVGPQTLSSVKHISVSSTHGSRKSSTRTKTKLENKINSWERIKSCLCLVLKMGLLAHLVLLCVVLLLVVFQTGSQESCLANLSVNMTELTKTLKQKVFGQHIVVNTIPHLVEAHLADKHKTTLVLSLHGWTGIGKNFVSAILAEQIKASTVHKLIIPLHFPHGTDGELYAIQLHAWVMGNITNCGVNLLILDEVDKASWDIPAALNNLLKHLHSISDNDTKVIVLLLSNTGGHAINKYLLNEMRRSRQRESITREELVSVLLSEEVFSKSSHYVLYHKALITELIPFLPLERTHVHKCVEQAILDEDIDVDENLVTEVANQLAYFPLDIPLFSKSGCRKVTDKLHLLTK